MKTSNLVAETIKEAFGNSAEDVIAPISSASDVCGWLCAILVAIRTETRKKNPSSITIALLADAAHYIACDFENFYDCQHGDMLDKLKQAGVIAAEVNRHE